MSPRYRDENRIDVFKFKLKDIVSMLIRHVNRNDIESTSNNDVETMLWWRREMNNDVENYCGGIKFTSRNE